jgi:16S rRNA (uracil1498-N3)-methyltransferase
MHVFLVSETEVDSLVTLEGDEAHHASRVLRCKAGDRVELLDGCGHSYLAEFQTISSREAELLILQKKPLPVMPFHLHLAVAPTKMMERYEWFLEKSVEIGISEITPLITRRSERKSIKMQRMEKITQAAVKQSRSGHFPVLHPETSFEEFIKTERSGQKFIAHCAEGEKPHLAKVAKSNQITLLIGPEGDFTPDEIEQAIDCAYTAVSLGNTRLRAETAAVVACSQIHTAFVFLND